MNLQGKTALITGSTSGIGEGIAQGLAAAGANIMLNGLGNADEIEAGRAALERDHGVEVGFCGVDLLAPDQVAALVEQTQQRFGRIDILVNNAGIQFTAPVEEFPNAKWQSIIGLNLSAVFYATKAALPAMKAQGWGRIINVASTHGLVASVEKAAYVASKHGVVGLTKVVALETARTNVTCNAICPGWVLTPLVKKQIEARCQEEGISFEEASCELLAEKQPSMKFVLPEELAQLAVFLCTEQAAQLTGQALPMDGGWTAQ